MPIEERLIDSGADGFSPIRDEELARPVSQTPAPPKERIKGSKENPKGTASTRSKAGDIEISEQNEEALKNKIAEFKDKHPSRKAPTLGALKKVFRRGAGAFSTSFRPTITGGKPNSRNAWAMARVNKFLKMAGGGEVKDSYRKADGDLLEERFDCGTGAGGFKEGNTCATGGGAGIGSSKASTKPPELMTPEEFKKSASIGKLQKATGKIVPGEEKAKTPLEIGELNKYSPKDIAHFYAKRDSYSKDKITDEGLKTGQAKLIMDAVSLKRSINAKSVEALKIKLPKNYILKDDKYIYKSR
jgi:hypothetical protein